MLLAETLRDIANVGAGAMVFGQFLAENVFSPSLALGGIGVWVVLVANAITLAGSKKS